jgi:hypothetical protein
VAYVVIAAEVVIVVVEVGGIVYYNYQVHNLNNQFLSGGGTQAELDAYNDSLPGFWKTYWENMKKCYGSWSGVWGCVTGS